MATDGGRIEGAGAANGTLAVSSLRSAEHPRQAAAWCRCRDLPLRYLPD